MFKSHAHRTMDMTEGSLLTKVLFFSLPIMLSGILQLLFNAADTIVVGRFAGNEALAAVGSVGSLNNMIISLFVGLSIGVNVLVARFTGAKDAERVCETVHTAVLLSLVGGAVLAVVGFAAARPLLEIMGSPEDVIDLAELYIRIIFIGMPVQMLYNFCAAVLRAVGDTKRPLYFLTIAGVINAGLNLVFVIGFKMSVAGVALATIISQAVSAALVTRSLMLMDGPTQLHLDRLAIKPHIMRDDYPDRPSGGDSELHVLPLQRRHPVLGEQLRLYRHRGQRRGRERRQLRLSGDEHVPAGRHLFCRAEHRRAQAAPCAQLDVCQPVLGAFLRRGASVVLSCVIRHAASGACIRRIQAVIQVGLNRMYIVCGPYFLCGIMDVMTGVLRGVGYSLLPMIVSLMGACVFRIFWVMTIFAANRTMDCLMISYPVSWALTFARAGGDLRGALEKENPAALYAGGIGGAIKQQNRPMVIRSVFWPFSIGRAQNAAGCMSFTLGALKCVSLFLKGFDRFDKSEVGL